MITVTKSLNNEFKRINVGRFFPTRSLFWILNLYIGRLDFSQPTMATGEIHIVFAPSVLSHFGGLYHGIGYHKLFWYLLFGRSGVGGAPVLTGRYRYLTFTTFTLSSTTRKLTHWYNQLFTIWKVGWTTLTGINQVYIKISSPQPWVSGFF